MEEVKDLTRKLHPEFVIIESGGDNLAANYSRELADYIIYVIDVAGKYPFPSPLSDHYTLRPSIFLPPAPPPHPFRFGQLTPLPSLTISCLQGLPIMPYPHSPGFQSTYHSLHVLKVHSTPVHAPFHSPEPFSPSLRYPTSRQSILTAVPVSPR